MKVVYQGLVGRFAAASSCTKTSGGLGRWRPGDSPVFYSFLKYLWCDSWESGLLGYLLLEERTWCLIQLVGERGCPGCLGLLALLPKEDWKLWMVS